MRLIGFDPGLRNTGWGVIDSKNNILSHVANGVVSSTPGTELALRLVELYEGIIEVIREYNPQEAAVEETFVNKNAVSTLKLGQARGIALLAPAHSKLKVSEYPPNLVKKTVVGTGHASKEQIQAMVRMLLPNAQHFSADSADALAISICHAHHRETTKRIIKSSQGKC